MHRCGALDHQALDVPPRFAALQQQAHLRVVLDVPELSGIAPDSHYDVLTQPKAAQRHGVGTPVWPNGGQRNPARPAVQKFVGLLNGQISRRRRHLSR